MCLSSTAVRIVLHVHIFTPKYAFNTLLIFDGPFIDARISMVCDVFVFVTSDLCYLSPSASTRCARSTDTRMSQCHHVDY